MGKEAKKWVFILLAKHGINKTWIRAIGLSFLRDQTVERERGEEKREEEEEEEKKKRRRGEAKIKKGMDSMIFNMELVYICMDTCLWVVGCEKPNPKMNACMEIFTNPFDLSRVLLEFHHNLRFLEIKVGKTPNVQEKHGILPLRLDSWINCKVKELG